MGQGKDKKTKIAFVLYHEYQDLWRDGLWAAIQLLSFDFEVTILNLWGMTFPPDLSEYSFILGWGAFGSPVDRLLSTCNNRKGLCIAGVSPPTTMLNYDVLFYETNWFLSQIDAHPNKIHAFGINTQIYKPMRIRKIFDYLTVGAFAFWKRQTNLLSKKGTRMAIGEIQKENIGESLEIIGDLLLGGVMISDMVEPKKLAELYNASKNVYIPANIYGGGERAVLEARACGVPVEVEPDNPKLIELCCSPVYDERYYASQLKKGVQSCL